MADHNKKTVTPSREIVTCDHCGKDFEKRHLKGHTERVHEGKKPKVRPPSNQRTLQFTPKSLKRVNVEGVNNNEAAKVLRTEEDDEVMESNDDNQDNQLNQDNLVTVDDIVTNAQILEEVKHSTEVLLECMRELKNDNENEKDKPDEDVDESGEYFGHMLRKAKSFVEIVTSISELKYIENKQVIICELCNKKDDGHSIDFAKNSPGVFKLENIEEPTDETDNMPDSFRNLKKSVKKHLNTQIHKQEILQLKQANTTSKKGPEIRNNNEAAMRCARVCYKLFKMGRPFTDYPELVALMVKSNVFMGDVNHSKEFPANFLTSVANVIREKIKTMLSSKLEQTQHVRPCKIIADKDTTKHRTRQLVCLTTVFPGASDFIQTVYIDHPLIKEHKTEDVAENVVKAAKQFISEDSYAGCSLDGAYFHAKKDVTQHINEHFNVDDEDVHSDHDPMHRSGLAEKRARKKTRNNWVNELGKIVATAFKDHNYGKKYEELRDMAELMEIEFVEPKFHSETRFANSCSKVFDSGFKDIPALIESYRKTKQENMDSNLQENRDKAKHATDMLRKLDNKMNLLNLAGICDIYSQFSKMVCELQKVNVLPFERHSNYQKTFNAMREMRASVNDHSKCVQQKCSWPKYHEYKDDILKGQLKSLKVTSNEGEPTNRILRSFFTRVTSDKPLYKRSEEKLENFLSDLLDELYHVYREEDLTMIELTRPLTDFTSLAMRIKERSAPVINALESKQFSKCCQKVCRSVKDVTSEELENQFCRLTKRLSILTKDISIKQLEEINSKDLIKQISSSPTLYEGIELVLRATYEASIKLSVESVAESVISVYNLHNSKVRPISEETANDELFIAFNGPEMGEADETLKEALNLHFAKKHGHWNFTTNSVFKTSSLTVKKILEKRNKMNIY